LRWVYSGGLGRRHLQPNGKLLSSFRREVKECRNARVQESMRDSKGMRSWGSKSGVDTGGDQRSAARAPITWHTGTIRFTGVFPQLALAFADQNNGTSPNYAGL